MMSSPLFEAAVVLLGARTSSFHWLDLKDTRIDKVNVYVSPLWLLYQTN